MPEAADTPVVTAEQLTHAAQHYRECGERLYLAAQHADSAAARHEDAQRSYHLVRIADALDTAANIMRGQ
jgi:hypothetical protein